ncbi:conserved hypothetical protein [Echinococcus multilocularis]|uniref:Colorectal mutant cancer protein n=1 Tax=Echinococcus multilocularis TaxID=6211 RepID=A0A068YI97_ECHMU|nr:conserved hypothetical protein [Echinococcus multilocularis]
MFRDSLSLNELRNAYPELYQFICQTDPTFGATDLEEAKEEVSRSKFGKGLKDQDFDHGFDVSQLLKESNSVTSLLTIRKAVSSIFESLNTVHVQKSLKLRLEIRDLCFRLQSLQTSRETDQREIYRLQRENDRCRRELAHQASRYEDRITELHGVLEELKRKASEMQNSNSTNNATFDVNDLVEVSDSDGETDAADAEAACTLSEFSAPESVLHPSIGQEDRSEPLLQKRAPARGGLIDQSVRMKGPCNCASVIVCDRLITIQPDAHANTSHCEFFYRLTRPFSFLVFHLMPFCESTPSPPFPLPLLLLPNIHYLPFLSALFVAIYCLLL